MSVGNTASIPNKQGDTMLRYNDPECQSVLHICLAPADVWAENNNPVPPESWSMHGIDPDGVHAFYCDGDSFTTWGESYPDQPDDSLHVVLCLPERPSEVTHLTARGARYYLAGIVADTFWGKWEVGNVFHVSDNLDWSEDVHTIIIEPSA